MTSYELNLEPEHILNEGLTLTSIQGTNSRTNIGGSTINIGNLDNSSTINMHSSSPLTCSGVNSNGNLQVNGNVSIVSTTPVTTFSSNKFGRKSAKTTNTLTMNDTGITVTSPLVVNTTNMTITDSGTTTFNSPVAFGNTVNFATFSLPPNINSTSNIVNSGTISNTGNVEIIGTADISELMTCQKGLTVSGGEINLTNTQNNVTITDQNGITMTGELKVDGSTISLTSTSGTTITGTATISDNFTCQKNIEVIGTTTLNDTLDCKKGSTITGGDTTIESGTNKIIVSTTGVEITGPLSVVGLPPVLIESIETSNVNTTEQSYTVEYDNCTIIGVFYKGVLTSDTTLSIGTTANGTDILNATPITTSQSSAKLNLISLTTPITLQTSVNTLYMRTASASETLTISFLMTVKPTITV